MKEPREAETREGLGEVRQLSICVRVGAALRANVHDTGTGASTLAG